MDGNSPYIPWMLSRNFPYNLPIYRLYGFSPYQPQSKIHQRSCYSNQPFQIWNGINAFEPIVTPVWSLEIIVCIINKIINQLSNLPDFYCFYTVNGLKFHNIYGPTIFCIYLKYVLSDRFTENRCG